MHLITKANIERSVRYIKDYGFSAFVAKARYTIGSILSTTRAVPIGFHDGQRKSVSIWDNSIDRYKKDDFKVYWELLPEVEKYQMKQITGDENLHFFWYTVAYIKKNIGEKNLEALLIGCSEGDPGIEMRLVESGMFNKVTVMDIAEGLLNKQRVLASKRGLDGIDYVKQDLNEAVLGKNTYDLIWAVGTIHHTEKLEILFDKINTALKENGVFVMREYVGPNYLQFTDFQLGLVNEILAILPKKYRKSADGAVKGLVKNVDVKYLKTIDPSESVRSEDIIEVMQNRLEIIKLAYTGGTLLHPLLDGRASNFEKDEDGIAVLRLLIFFEKTLIREGILPSDYVFCMAKKRLPL